MSKGLGQNRFLRKEVMNVGDDFVGRNAWLRGESKLRKDLRGPIYYRDKTVTKPSNLSRLGLALSEKQSP